LLCFSLCSKPDFILVVYYPLYYSLIITRLSIITLHNHDSSSPSPMPSTCEVHNLGLPGCSLWKLSIALSPSTLAAGSQLHLSYPLHFPRYCNCFHKSLELSTRSTSHSSSPSTITGGEGFRFWYGRGSWAAFFKRDTSWTSWMRRWLGSLNR
jgi:hypothetical protein